MDIITESDMAGIFESITDIDSANAYKIDCSFEKRFHVWKDQLLPDYLSLAKKNQLEIPNIESRLRSDYMMILRRATKENVSEAKTDELRSLYQKYLREIIDAQAEYELVTIE